MSQATTAPTEPGKRWTVTGFWDNREHGSWTGWDSEYWASAWNGEGSLRKKIQATSFASTHEALNAAVGELCVDMVRTGGPPGVPNTFYWPLTVIFSGGGAGQTETEIAETEIDLAWKWDGKKWGPSWRTVERYFIDGQHREVVGEWKLA